VETKSESASSRAATPAAPPASAATAAEKSSFQEVTSQLDPGGSLFAYFGTEQWISGASQQVSSWREILSAVPGLGAEQRGEANKAFDLAVRLINKSGIEEISGVGISGIAREKGFYRSKLIVHHYPGRNSGYIWSLFGAAPHPLEGMAMSPATSALTAFGDVDLRGMWTVLQRELGQSGIKELEEWTGKFPRDFETKTGLNFESLLDSLGGEFGFVLTLDDTRKVALPLPIPQPLEIPEPRLALVIKVKNDVLFNHLDRLLQSNPQVERVDEEGLRMRTMPSPAPLPFPFRPTLARAGDYLFVGSTETLIREMLAALAGKAGGLKGTDEYKRMAQGIPEQGNSFVFVSPRLSETVAGLQAGAMSAWAGRTGGDSRFLQRIFGQGQGGFSYSVSANTAEGWVSVSNGNSDPSSKALIMATMQPAAVVGLLAAIAIPNFVKARSTAQQNVIFNNLRIIEGAKDQWALEHRKATGDSVTEQDLAPYLRDGKINAILGETYTLNAIGTPASATAPVQVGSHPPGSKIRLP
jgi:hypothetical protein